MIEIPCIPPYLQLQDETKPHSSPTADQPSCIMRCRTTVGTYLLSLPSYGHVEIIEVPAQPSHLNKKLRRAFYQSGI